MNMTVVYTYCIPSTVDGKKPGDADPGGADVHHEVFEATFTQGAKHVHVHVHVHCIQKLSPPGCQTLQLYIVHRNCLLADSCIINK